MSRFEKLRRQNLWKLLLLVFLIGTAVYFWGQPARHEAQLRAASLKSLQTIASQHSQDDRAFFYLGLRQRNAGLWEDALKSLEKAAELRPSREETWLALAETAQAQDRQRAYDYLNVFLNDFPEALRARLLLASFYLYDRDFERAYEEARRVAAADPKSELAWRLAGRAAINRNEPEKATEAMQKAFDLNPKNWENRTGLGNAYALRSQWNDALALYDKAIAVAPKAALPHYLKGMSLVTRADSNEDFQQAITEFRAALALDPEMPLASRGLGIGLARLKRWDEAVLALEEARSRDPQDEAVAFHLGTVYRELNQPQAAEAEIQRHSRLVAYHQKKQTLYEEMARLDTNSPELAPRRRQLAELMARNGEDVAAIDQYRKLLRRNPDDTDAKTRMNALIAARPATLTEARNLLAQGRFANAEAAFLTILKGDKANALALEGMAIALKRQDKEEGAFLYALEAARRSPNLATAQQMLGSLYAKARYNQEAAFRFQKAVEIQPQDAHSWHQLGIVLREVTGKDTDAANAFQKAMELKPDDPTIRLDLAEMLLALERKPEAEKVFREALAMAPNDAAVLARVGAFLISTADGTPSRKQEALTLITRAQSLEPSDTFIKYQMARLTEDPRKAIPMFQEVIAKATGTEIAEVWYALGQAYRRAGDAKRAKEAVAMSERIQMEYIAYVQKLEKVAMKPNDSALRLDLARAYMARGENAKALQEYERCLALAPKNKTIQQEKDSLTRRLKQTGKMPNMALFRKMLATAQTGSRS